MLFSKRPYPAPAESPNVTPPVRQHPVPQGAVVGGAIPQRYSGCRLIEALHVVLVRRIWLPTRRRAFALAIRIAGARKCRPIVHDYVRQPLLLGAERMRCALPTTEQREQIL